MTILELPVRDRIYVGLDGDDYLEACHTVEVMVDLGLTKFKVGKRLINAGQAERITIYIRSKGGEVFNDNKDIDIEATMVGAIKNIAIIGATMATVMAEAGSRRLKAVQDAAGDVKVIGVTVLTDMDDDECIAIYGAPVAPTVRRFAGFAEEADLWALVSSAEDLENLREFGIATKQVKITPAIRPTWAASNDQKRFTTPTQAFELGADLLVVSRPLIRPPESFQGKRIATPEVATKLFIEECEEFFAA